MNGPTRVSFVVAVLPILAFFAASAQAARCRPCEVTHERCSANCFGRDEAEIGGCLVACYNEAATCSCDEAVTLSSEDFVARFGSPAVTGLAEACHSTTPCGTAYPSCASWTPYDDCGDPRCVFAVQGCGACGLEDPCIGKGLRQSIERYRVCFNAMGESCTEYQRSDYILGCGC
jgi:hypothetical protein